MLKKMLVKKHFFMFPDTYFRDFLMYVYMIYMDR